MMTNGAKAYNNLFVKLTKFLRGKHYLQNSFDKKLKSVRMKLKNYNSIMTKDIFSVFLKAINGTPIRVMIIFAYVIFIGIKSMRDRIVYLPKLFIIPAIFIGMKYKIFNLENPLILLYYLLTLLSGFSIGYLLGMKAKIEFLKNIKSVKLPGNYYTIFIILSFFSIKYFFGYIDATNSELAIKYYPLDICVSALYSGYFLGRAISCFYRYIKS